MKQKIKRWLTEIIVPIGAMAAVVTMIIRVEEPANKPQAQSYTPPEAEVLDKLDNTLVKLEKLRLGQLELRAQIKLLNSMLLQQIAGEVENVK